MYKDIIIAGILMVTMVLVIVVLWPSYYKSRGRGRTKIYKKK